MQAPPFSVSLYEFEAAQDSDEYACISLNAPRVTPPGHELLREERYALSGVPAHAFLVDLDPNPRLVGNRDEALLYLGARVGDHLFPHRLGIEVSLPLLDRRSSGPAAHTWQDAIAPRKDATMCGANGMGRDQFVDKAIASADDFNRPMQDLTTEYCWGYVWGRDGITHKTRSFLNLAMLCALNRPQELKTHIKGALTNGATREEIREVFMQVAIYCGVPAGVDAFRNAKEVFAELDKK